MHLCQHLYGAVVNAPLLILKLYEAYDAIWAIFYRIAEALMQLWRGIGVEQHTLA